MIDSNNHILLTHVNIYLLRFEKLIIEVAYIKLINVDLKTAVMELNSKDIGMMLCRQTQIERLSHSIFDSIVALDRLKLLNYKIL